MVFDPLAEPLWMLKHLFQGDVPPANVLRPVSRMMIEGLRYLHTQSHIIQTGIAPLNLLKNNYTNTCARSEIRQCPDGSARPVCT